LHQLSAGFALEFLRGTRCPHRRYLAYATQPSGLANALNVDHPAFVLRARRVAPLFDAGR